MSTATSAALHSTPLAHWLRLLWGRAPPPRLDAPAPFIADGHIHLPAAAHWRDHCAAAAHAAAHLVYSPRGFDGTGLVPIARTLLAALEDARVEALAMRELPGLARLWRPLHSATPDSGDGFEPLLQRLGRALADPAYHDPHPWVRKGRRLFYLDEALGLPALRTPAELRSAAMALGHDIGQARLPFNAKGHRPAPAYRDDHRWMWPADQLTEVAPPPAPPPGSSSAPPPPDAPELPPTDRHSITRHPEWDRLIQRLRPDWCTVIEGHGAGVDTGPAARAAAAAAASGRPPPHQALARRLRAPLRRLAGPLRARQLAQHGELIDLDALVHWQMARRAGQPADPRVHRAPQRGNARAAVWLLVDQSASSADATHLAHPANPADAASARGGAGGGRLIDVAAQAAAATALALRAMGVACAVSGFSSQGRHAVRLHTLQGLRPAPPGGPDDHHRSAAPDALAAQLQALRCGGSTRLGAALRHAVLRLSGWRAGPRWVLLLSDAQAHDIDVHDPHYLRADARQAVRAAALHGVRVGCLTLGAATTAAADLAAARQLFGPRAAQPLPSALALPRALQRLLG